MSALDPQMLIDEACAATGLDDFGEDLLTETEPEPTWREGLDRLVEALNTEASLNEVGPDVTKVDLDGHLRNRLRIVDQHRRHPEMAERDVIPPVVIMGQARTGTTILYDLLGQDPTHRVPLSWEVDEPVPPPETATYDSDPRIAEVQAKFDASEVLIPGFLAMHPLGATLGQECVRMTGGEFCSMVFPTQWRVPSYSRWVANEADMAAAYRYHRRFLQLLQWRHPGERWVLKSPGHIWSLEALLTEYPDALLIQTHRDPLATIASISSLVSLLRQMATDVIDIGDVAAEWSELLIAGFDRSVAARRTGLISSDQVIDVQFTDFLADPFAEVRRVYDHFGFDLGPGVEQSMKDFLADHHQDKHGRHQYRFSDTGLDEAELRARTADYVEFFDVPLQQLG